MLHEIDMVVVGAGCSGLSLAVQFVEQGLGDKRLLLIDPRTEFSRDRTWCFFGLGPHGFSRAVSHRWQRWSVMTHTQNVCRHGGDVTYEHLPGDAFYRHALGLLEGHPKVTVELGTTVLGVVDRGDHVAVETARGSLRAGVVFDSRPPALAADGQGLRSASRGDVSLLQHFMGWFVRTEKPAFDPTTAVLMDFRLSQQKGIHFMYVLPFSETEALVEDTYFSDHPLDTAEYERAIAMYLQRRGVLDYTCSGKERGTIPMTTRPFDARPSARVYRIGTAAGLVRPATGYAFSAIQRHSRALAMRFSTVTLGDRLPDPPAPRHPRTAWLDRVFLSYLRRHPDEAPELFASLFAQTSPARLARFLAEESSAVDDLHVMRALPSTKLGPEGLRTVLAQASARLKRA